MLAFSREKHMRTIAAAALAIVGVFAFCVSPSAQALGTIEGIVKDKGGAVLPGVTVLIAREPVRGDAYHSHRRERSVPRGRRRGGFIHGHIPVAWLHSGHTRGRRGHGGADRHR
jgi:hypothetical protein